MIWWPLVFGVIGTTDSHPTRGLPLHGRRSSVMNCFTREVCVQGIQHALACLMSEGVRSSR
jgi:hypothetical protein